MIEPLLVLLLFVVVLDVVGFVVVLVVVLDIGLVHEHPTTDNNKLKIALIFINLFIFASLICHRRLKIYAIRNFSLFTIFHKLIY